ncbi:MAG TPA: GNAT family N-acetyltransferase [Trueperaceae bacterium]|nr:GNAT family N-acetyltransferase [Trueperaceae bacterium]
MIQAEVEVGGALGVNHPAPDHCFALRLDDELALRLTERHHAPELYRLVAADRDHLRRWIPWTATATPEWVAELVADELARFGSGQGWRAELCFRGRPIGLMWLHEWGGAGGSTEVGYLVARAYEGKGLVTRALRALVRHFFVERGVGRVAVGLDARNERSLAVVQRLGLRPEAVLRRVIAVDGEPADLSIFGLLREEYAPPPEDGPRVRRPPRFALRAAADDDVYVGLLERDDAATLHRLVEANRERLARWLPWAREGGPEAQERFVAERAMPSVARGPGLEAGIWLGDELIGAAGVHDVDVRSRSGAIGYWLDAAHEGKGVVTKVVRALVNRCFAEPLVDGEPFERLEVLAQVDNVRSRAVAERLGFTFEGVLRRQNLGPDRPDMAVYGLLRSEWEAASRDDGTGRAPAPAP